MPILALATRGWALLLRIGHEHVREADDGVVSEVIVFERDRHFRLANVGDAERTFEWIDFESGLLDGFYISDGEVLVPSQAEDGIYVKLARSGRFTKQELADRLASSRLQEI